MDKFEVGEEVIIVSHWSGRHVGTVERVTPTGIATVGGQRYNKHGDLIGATGYFKPYIKKASPEEIERVSTIRRMNDKRDTVRALLSNLKTLGESELDAIIELLSVE